MNESGRTGGPWLRSRSAFLLFVVLALAGLYLVVTHSTHVLGVLPYVVLLACPLMHFPHRGHGGKHSSHGGTPPIDKKAH